MMSRHVASVEMHLRRSVIIAGYESKQDFSQKLPLLLSESSHDAEVDSDQPAVNVDEEVTWMHIGVEKAVAQGMAQKALNDFAAELRQVKAPRSQSTVIVETDAINPLERQHFSRGAVPIDSRHAEIGVLARVFCHLGSGSRFQSEIHFNRNRASER